MMISKFQAEPKKAVDDLIDVNVSQDGKNHGDPLVQNVHVDLKRKQPPTLTKSATSKDKLSDD